ncbi:hypothetical protein NHG23_02685 [Aerococcaceae bacterium NML190073]|nr:hypothetical protein [Aerococcaceae bacterium NML190073]
MHITTIKAADGSRPEIIRPTEAEQQNEYDYILAESLTKKLLEKGLISVDEFNKIMEKNRRTFSPLFSRI